MVNESVNVPKVIFEINNFFAFRFRKKVEERRGQGRNLTIIL